MTTPCRRCLIAVFGEGANILNFCIEGSSSIYYPHTVLAFRERFPRPLDVLLVSL